MRVTLKVVTRSRRRMVEGPSTDGIYKVHVHAPPVDGAANEEVIEVLADHFGVRKSAVRIVLGQQSTRKVAEVDGTLLPTIS